MSYSYQNTSSGQNLTNDTRLLQATPLPLNKSFYYNHLVTSCEDDMFPLYPRSINILGARIEE
jgi:hypothetical protein